MGVGVIYEGGMEGGSEMRNLDFLNSVHGRKALT